MYIILFNSHCAGFSSPPRAHCWAKGTASTWSTSASRHFDFTNAIPPFSFSFLFRFLFAAQGALLGQRYRFNLVNFCKAHSLYHDGMRPLLYSAKAAEKGTGWRRGGEQVLYFENGCANTLAVRLRGSGPRPSNPLTPVSLVR